MQPGPQGLTDKPIASAPLPVPAAWKPRSRHLAGACSPMKIYVRHKCRSGALVAKNRTQSKVDDLKMIGGLHS